MHSLQAKEQTHRCVPCLHGQYVLLLLQPSPVTREEPAHRGAANSILASTTENRNKATSWPPASQELAAGPAEVAFSIRLWSTLSAALNTGEAYG